MLAIREQHTILPRWFCWHTKDLSQGNSIKSYLELLKSTEVSTNYEILYAKYFANTFLVINSCKSSSHLFSFLLELLYNLQKNILWATYYFEGWGWWCHWSFGFYPIILINRFKSFEREENIIPNVNNDATTKETRQRA